jgi:hypothetical protein
MQPLIRQPLVHFAGEGETRHFWTQFTVSFDLYTVSLPCVGIHVEFYCQRKCIGRICV